MQLIHVLRSLGLLLVLGSNSPLPGQHTTGQLHSLFTELHQHDKFNGNVLVAQKGQVMFAKSYGKADEQQERALDIQSVFELASVSKQFTAMGIVLLKKQQKLDYDDKLADYIPELAFYRG